MSESGSGMEIVHVEPTRPLEARMSNTTAVAAVLAQIEESNRLARELVAALTSTEQAKDVTTVAPTVPVTVAEPKPVKAPTFTGGRLKDLKALGIIPNLTTQKQALAGVDFAGKPLSDEALEIIAACKAPTGEMKQHFHDLKESGAPRTPKAEKPAAAPVVDKTVEAKVLELVEGGFTAEEIKQILSI